ncbi:MAG: hypothetical protein AAB739_00490 [Patescibacteria group bacterium]
MSKEEEKSPAATEAVATMAEVDVQAPNDSTAIDDVRLSTKLESDLAILGFILLEKDMPAEEARELKWTYVHYDGSKIMMYKYANPWNIPDYGGINSCGIHLALERQPGTQEEPRYMVAMSYDIYIGECISVHTDNPVCMDKVIKTINSFMSIMSLRKSRISLRNSRI